MKHRIRSAAFLVLEDKVLLVHHFNKTTQHSFWVPPGGGLEALDTSMFDCARRETHEETGLTASISRIVYIREFYEASRDVHHLELFCLADSFEGEVSLDHLPKDQPDSDMITESRWLSRSELENLTVYPQILKTDFWDHYENDFPNVIYLGRQDEED